MANQNLRAGCKERWWMWKEKERDLLIHVFPEIFYISY